ncbi:hypothetical protein [Arthrobacter zhaoguopingii]|uniref:hypothetical protein n=1 Tax=Arthrobacter zhaoguopingii TaxID=2681491 RepID=UPI001357E253|nr:hypothetical protein [Arthrobacter zhaoguopingii]
MRLPNFQSEFAPHEVPDLTQARVSNTELDAEVAKVPEDERIEISQQNLIRKVVKDFYFAKYFFLRTNTVDYEGDGQLQRTFVYLSHQMLKQAVISVATTIDLTSGRPVDGKKRPGRTASMPHLLERIKKTLEDLDADASAELELVEHIRKSVDPKDHLTLKYVQYMRNKWAGHASMDRRFDTWMQANDSLSIAAVEAALVRVVNAYEDFSDLVEMSDSLTEKTKKPEQTPTIDADGHSSWKMTVDWSNIRTFAPLLRESSQKEVDLFFETLSASVN